MHRVVISRTLSKDPCGFSIRCVIMYLILKHHKETFSMATNLAVSQHCAAAGQRRIKACAGAFLADA